MSNSSPIGSIVWRDLTVPNASEVRDFYTAVVGWTAKDHSMGEYNDFDIHDASGECVTGICHALDTNAGVPPQWLMYVKVADVDASAAKAVELGGKIIDGPRQMGPSKFAVVQDPAGAVIALID